MNNVKFYPGASQTLKQPMKDDIRKKLEKALENSKTFKRAEVATLGEVYHDQRWRNTKKMLVTTMHVARFLKR